MITLEQFDATMARIDPLLDKWMPLLGLADWTIRARYVLASQDMEYPTAQAECDARWQYMHAVIRFNVPELVQADDGEIEHVVVHELMHVLVNEMREDGIAHEERVCEMLARAMGRVGNAHVHEEAPA